MNMSRPTPEGVAKEDLDIWLCNIINDAMRAAVEAGLDTNYAAHAAITIGESYLGLRSQIDHMILIAARMFGLKPEDVTPEQRLAAKQATFWERYSRPITASNLERYMGTTVTREQLEQLKERVPSAVREFFENFEESADGSGDSCRQTGEE